MAGSFWMILCLLFDRLDFVHGVVVGVDASVVDALESDCDRVSDGGLVGGNDISDLVVPVGFLAEDFDLVPTLEGECGGGNGSLAQLSGGKGRDRNGKEEEGEEGLDGGEHGGNNFVSIDRNWTML